MNRFVVALMVGLGLRDDSSLEDSSTGNALFFWLGLFRLGLGLGFDIVPTDDSSLEESSAGACIVTPPVVMALAVAIASLDHVFVAVVVGGENVVVGGAKFVAAAHADKEGNADVGLVDVNPTYHDIVPTAQVVTRGAMADVVVVGGTAVAVDNDVDVDIVVVGNGDAIAVAVAARVHVVLVALDVAVCGSTGDSRMVALQMTSRGGSCWSSSYWSCSVSVAEEEASLFPFGFVSQAAQTLLSSSAIVLQQAAWRVLKQPQQMLSGLSRWVLAVQQAPAQHTPLSLLGESWYASWCPSLLPWGSTVLLIILSSLSFFK
jgi:hypothetical protein